MSDTELMDDQQFRESMGGLVDYLVDAQEREKQRQMTKLAALTRLKDVLVESLRKCFPEATDREIRHAALVVMIDMVETGGLNVYVNTGGENDDSGEPRDTGAETPAPDREQDDGETGPDHREPAG